MDYKIIFIVIFINFLSVLMWYFRDYLIEKNFFKISIFKWCQLIYVFILSNPLWIRQFLAIKIGIFDNVNFYKDDKLFIKILALNRFVLEKGSYVAIITIIATILITFYVLALGEQGQFKTYLLNLIIGKELLIDGIIFISFSLLFGVNHIFLYGITLFMIMKLLEGSYYHQKLSDDQWMESNFKDKILVQFWSKKLKNENLLKTSNLYNEIKKNLYLAVKNENVFESKKYYKFLEDLLAEDVESISDKKRHKKNEEFSNYQIYSYIRDLYRICIKTKNITVFNEIYNLHHIFAEFYKEIGDKDGYYLSLYNLNEIYEFYQALPKRNRQEIEISVVSGFNYGVASNIIYKELLEYSDETLGWLIATYNVVISILQKTSEYSDDFFFKTYLQTLDIKSLSYGRLSINYLKATVAAYIHLLLMIEESKINIKYKENIFKIVSTLLKNISYKEPNTNPLCSSIIFINEKRVFKSLRTDDLFRPRPNYIKAFAYNIVTEEKINKIFIELLNKNMDHENDIIKYFEANYFRYQKEEDVMNEKIKRYYHKGIKQKEEKKKEEIKNIELNCYKDKLLKNLHDKILKSKIGKVFSELKEKIGIKLIDQQTKFKYINHLNSKELLKDASDYLIEEYSGVILDSYKNEFFKQVFHQSKLEEISVEEAQQKKNNYIIFKTGYPQLNLVEKITDNALEISKGRTGVFLIDKKYIKKIIFYEEEKNHFEFKEWYNIYLDEALKAEEKHTIMFDNIKDLNQKFSIFIIWNMEIEMKNDSILYQVKQ